MHDPMVYSKYSGNNLDSKKSETALPVSLSRPQLFLISIAITFASTFVVYYLMPTISLIGIDDANIVQIYAKNIAKGYGYVYYPGGERVEGSTSFLWTIINVLPFFIGFHPELAILGICIALTTISTFLVLDITSIICSQSGLPSSSGILIMSLLQLGSTMFYAWSTWTLMDLSLWVTLYAAILGILVKGIVPVETDTRINWKLTLATTALVLTRPEGIVVSLGLLGGAAAIRLIIYKDARIRSYRWIIYAACAALAALVFITLFRILYFGYPFPNTYYAKVSSDFISTASAGMNYIRDFPRKVPFVTSHIVALMAFVLFLTIKTFRSDAGQFRDMTASLLLLGGSSCGTLFLYALLGGDHFPFFRFLQPVVLILPVSTAVALVFLQEHLRTTGPRQGWISKAVTILMAGFIAVSGIRYFAADARRLVIEFTLAESGRLYGEALNEIAEKHGPMNVAVVAAGGSGFSYKGPVYDLLGLNWVEMAHASSEKIGIRNHASFNHSVFWKLHPDIIYSRPFYHDGKKPWAFNSFSTNTLKGLLSSVEFRKDYQPMEFSTRAGIIGVFVSRRWSERASPSNASAIDWSQVTVFQTTSAIATVHP
jgi:arabinofuranosyltransferase